MKSSTQQSHSWRSVETGGENGPPRGRDWVNYDICRSWDTMSSFKKKIKEIFKRWKNKQQQKKNTKRETSEVSSWFRDISTRYVEWVKPDLDSMYYIILFLKIKDKN